jgi:hypothetical protein
MPKSKARKNHKSKVAARNVAVKNESARVQKAQKEFIMNLIKQEQEKGLFDNAQAGPMVSGPMVSGPMIGGGPLSFDGDLLTFDGPTFDGPIVDNVIDVPVVDETTPQSETEEATEEVKENN